MNSLLVVEDFHQSCVNLTKFLLLKSKSVAGWATSKGKCTVIILTRASQKGTQFHPVLEHCIPGPLEPEGAGGPSRFWLEH